jgi:hypothetical protein
MSAAAYALLLFGIKLLPEIEKMIQTGVPEVTDPAKALKQLIFDKFLPKNPDGTPWTLDDVQRFADAADAPLDQVFAVFGDTLASAASRQS